MSTRSEDLAIITNVSQLLVPLWLEVVLLVCAVVGLVFTVRLAVRQFRTGDRKGTAAGSLYLFLSYLLCIGAYGLLYHSVVRASPHGLLVNPELASATVIRSAQWHGEMAEKADATRRIIELTVHLLDRDESRQQLEDLVRALPAELRGVYGAAAGMTVLHMPPPLVEALLELGPSVVAELPDRGVGNAEAVQKWLLLRKGLTEASPSWARLQAVKSADLRALMESLYRHFGRGIPPLRPALIIVWDRGTHVSADPRQEERLGLFLRGVLGVDVAEKDRVELIQSIRLLEFARVDHALLRWWWSSKPGALLECLYFSSVTMATLGYGDVLPNSPLMKVAAATESLAGIAATAFLLSALTDAGMRKEVKRRLRTKSSPPR